MVAEDFLQDPQIRGWLDGVEPAWTLLTCESLRALRHEPSAVQTAIRVANDLRADEFAGSAVARNTLILLRQAIERGGLPLTATGNLSRAVVAEMCKLIEWPEYDQAGSFRFNKVINEPDFLPLHVVRLLAQAATLVRAQHGKLVATPLLALRAISLIWRRYNGREAALYLLEGELASHNCEGERENDPECKFSDAAREVAAEEDARQRAHQQRAEYVPIDRAQHPVSDPGDERQGHRMGDVGADDPRHGKAGIKQD